MAVLFEALFPPCSSLRALRTRQLEGDAPSPGQEASLYSSAFPPHAGCSGSSWVAEEVRTVLGSWKNNDILLGFLVVCVSWLHVSRTGDPC